MSDESEGVYVELTGSSLRAHALACLLRFFILQHGCSMQAHLKDVVLFQSAPLKVLLQQQSTAAGRPIACTSLQHSTAACTPEILNET